MILLLALGIARFILALSSELRVDGMVPNAERGGDGVWCVLLAYWGGVVH